jgi:hypothetical protein
MRCFDTFVGQPVKEGGASNEHEHSEKSEGQTKDAELRTEVTPNSIDSMRMKAD